MRILKPFGITKGTESEQTVASQQVSETPYDPNAMFSKSDIHRNLLEQVLKKQKQLNEHRKQFKKEYHEFKKEYHEFKKEYRGHKKEYKESKKEYREHKKEYRRNHRLYYSEKFDTYMAERAEFNGGFSCGNAGFSAQSATSKTAVCPNEKRRLKSQNSSASWGGSSAKKGDENSSHSSACSEDGRSSFNNDSKLRFKKINLLPATRVKNKFNQYCSAFVPSSSNSKAFEEKTLPELRRTASQTSLETITDAKQRRSENVSLQSNSSASSSTTKYEISDSTLNANDSTEDELAGSLRSLDIRSITDESLISVGSSDLSVYSYSSLPSSFSVPSSDFSQPNRLSGEISSVNQDFIEFNQRFEVMHNLNPTIPIRHQRLAELNTALPDRLNSMTGSVLTFSTGSELEFSDVETYQTIRTDNGDRDEEDDVKIVVRGEELD